MRYAYHSSLEWKSRTSQLTGIVSLKQGCPLWGGIWRKPRNGFQA